MCSDLKSASGAGSRGLAGFEVRACAAGRIAEEAEQSLLSRSQHFGKLEVFLKIFIYF